MNGEKLSPEHGFPVRADRSRLVRRGLGQMGRAHNRRRRAVHGLFSNRRLFLLGKARRHCPADETRHRDAGQIRDRASRDRTKKSRRIQVTKSKARRGAATRKSAKSRSAPTAAKTGTKPHLRAKRRKTSGKCGNTTGKRPRKLANTRCWRGRPTSAGAFSRWNTPKSAAVISSITRCPSRSKFGKRRQQDNFSTCSQQGEKNYGINI